MNAAIRAVARAGIQAGWEVIGFRRGYAGLIDDVAIELDARSVANIVQRGGSILDTTREDRFHDPAARARARSVLADHECSALITIGGEGTQAGAATLQSEWDGAVIGIPSTIDNDLGGTDRSIGFDTACNTALEAIDRIRDTASTLDRLFLIEVMGRHSGFIALEVAIGGGAEAVLLPEVPFDCEALAKVIQSNYERGKLSCIIVVAEGAHPGGARGLLQEMDARGVSLEAQPGAGARVTILGHIQRGGNPTVRDRVLASRLGVVAVDAATKGRKDILLGVSSRAICETKFAEALMEKREIDPTLLALVHTLAG
jgi:6-phosphofructokinase 1